MRKILIALMVFFSFNAFSMSSKNSPFIVIISPKHGAIWYEGEIHVIKWISKNIKKVCIEPLIGGHPAGILGNCKVNASKGEFVWHIPRGFVSNFGVNNAEVRIYICNKDQTYCRFRKVLIKSIKVNPIRRKPKPI